jgi:Glycosyl transferase family 2
MRASGMAKNALLMALRRAAVDMPELGGSNRPAANVRWADRRRRIVVVDNGSTDNTAEIIHGWAALLRGAHAEASRDPRSFPDDIG